MVDQTILGLFRVLVCEADVFLELAVVMKCVLVIVPEATDAFAVVVQHVT